MPWSTPSPVLGRATLLAILLVVLLRPLDWHEDVLSLWHKTDQTAILDHTLLHSLSMLPTALSCIRDVYRISSHPYRIMVLVQ